MQDGYNTRLSGEHPEVVFDAVRQQFGVDYDTLVDFMYHLNAVRLHGWGTVIVTVADKGISKFESTIRTISHKETNYTLKAQPTR